MAHLPGDGLTPGELTERTSAAVGGREPLAFLAGPERVRTVAIVSGGGSPYLRDAIGEGLDVFVTGEPTEWVMLLAQEPRDPLPGRRPLCDGDPRRPPVSATSSLSDFGVEHTFIDVPNPI